MSRNRQISRQRFVRRPRDERDHRGHRSGGVGGIQDAAEGPGGRGLDLHGCLVGLDLEEDFARGNGVAYALVPGDDATLIHREPKLGKDHARDAQPTSSFAARTMSST
jgi:hypothetical protein